MNQNILTKEAPPTLHQIPRPKEILALEAKRSAARETILEQLSILLTPTPSLQMTYKAFLDWADEDTLAEWIALPGTENLGEVVMTSPASDRHQDLTRFLVSVLSIYVEQTDSGIIRSAPFQMKLEHGREPDLLFVATEHLERRKKTYLDGPADLVIEIISPESINRDRGEKFYEYARGGIPEYWLIDCEMEWAEFYQLQGQRYHLVMEGHAGKYTSTMLPDFWLNIEWLWQDPLPPILEIARTLGLM